RNTFGDAYYAFFNPTDTTAMQQTLTLQLSDAIFPYSNLGTPSITDVTAIVGLTEPLTKPLSSALAAMSIAGTFGPTAAPETVVFKAATGTAPGGGAIPALAADAPFAPSVAPGSFTLTIPSSSVPPSLQTTGSSPARLNSSLIEDIALLITYKLA